MFCHLHFIAMTKVFVPITKLMYFYSAEDIHVITIATANYSYSLVAHMDHLY